MNKGMTPNKSGSVNPSVKSIESFLNLSNLPQNMVNAQTMSQLAYHELADVPVREVDALDQLEKNIQTLSDLRSRLQFLNREIRYLMKL